MNDVMTNEELQAWVDRSINLNQELHIQRQELKEAVQQSKELHLKDLLNFSIQKTGKAEVEVKQLKKQAWAVQQHLQDVIQAIDRDRPHQLSSQAMELANRLAGREATGPGLQATAELKATETELEASLALLQATLESIASGVVVVSIQGEVLTFNQPFAQMWQIPETVVLSRDCERAKAFFETQLKDPNPFRRSIWEVSSQSEAEGYEILELKDGRTFAQYAKPQYLGNKIIGRVWSVWDITPFTRKAGLGQDQEGLRAQQLSQLKVYFTSCICHQLRSLLNVISFSNSLLRRHAHHWTVEKQQPYLEHIQTATEQISQLLDEVLLFGKSEIAKLQYDPKPVDLNVFSQALLEQLQPITTAFEQSIHWVNRGHCCHAWADPNLLQPVLMNLLSNAVKYSPPGSMIEFELDCQADHVIYQVRDTGIGIPVADQARLFEPFHRGSNVGKIQSTGLGLATVKNLLDLQEGQIKVVSEVGVGTTVTVTLPKHTPEGGV